MYSLIQRVADGPWLILRPDGTTLYVLDSSDEAYARQILANLNNNPPE